MGIFKAYDVRGIYGKNLSEKEAYFLGYYFVKYSGLKNLKLAKDCRLSGDELAKYFVLGAFKSDCNIEYQGEISTVNFYHTLFAGVNSGVIITASHNPKEYNGFKFILNGVSFDSRNGLMDVEKLIDENKDNLSFNEIEKKYIDYNFEKLCKELDVKKNHSSLEEYINFLKNFVNKKFSKKDIEILRNLNFSLDYSSGMSGLALVSLFNSLGFSKLTHLNFMPDGRFPIHSPDPFKVDDYLKNKNNTGYFTGVFDGDGDRICFYDKNGNFVFQDRIIEKFIEVFSKEHKNFVVDLRVSKSIFDLAKKLDVSVEKLRVGRAFYQDYMKENFCFFGAELSGHLFFEEFNYMDNPDIGIIYILKFVLEEIKKVGMENFEFENLFSKYLNYYKLKEWNVEVQDTDLALKKLFENYEKNLVSEMDGFSFELDNVWFNIRKSNTEPILRINLEGNSQKDVDSFRNELALLLK